MSDTAIERLNAALEGRYRIERELGEGGMATVYLADDLRHERKVALKVLKPELAAVVGAERFLAEIKTTANLQHPHILPLFDSGEAEQFLFYVMPFVEGESLRGKLDREHQLPVDAAVRIASDVAEALDYAHRQGVIHRDIKPANILLQDGKPVISDFGIALAVSAGGADRLTETGLSVGTPHYMSPEQATGDQHVGTATDIYALGCVLYEMLVGEPPFTRSTPQAILGKIIVAESVSVTVQRKTVPANVDAAISRALEKLPADRFAKPGELARALADPEYGYVSGGASAAGPVQGLFNPLSLSLGALTLLLGLALGRFALAPVAEPNRLPISRQVISVPPAAPLVPSAGHSDVAISADGRSIAYQSAVGPGQLVVRALDELESVTLRGPSAALGPIWSPDGGSLAFQGRDGLLQRVSVSGGPPLPIAPLPGGLLGASWGPDDAIVFGTTREEGLRQVSATTGEVTSLTETDGTFAHVHPDVLPNGEGILFVVSATWRTATDDQIAVLDLTTGEHRVIIESGTSPRYATSGHIVYALGSTLMAVAFDAERLAVTGVPVPVLEGINVKFNGSASFSLSASGSLVYVSGTEAFGAPRVAVWVDRDGEEESLPLPPQQYFYPRLSPDAARLAVSVEDPVGFQVWVFDVASAAPVRLTAQGRNHAPVWMSDSLVAFTSEEANGRLRLHSVMADGTAEPRPLVSALDEIDRDFPSSITPDGRHLIFSRSRSAYRAILQLPILGDAVPEPLLQGEFLRGGAKVSPDGRWLAYSSIQTEQLEVYVQPYPQGSAVRAPIGSGRSHAWSPDGSELIYRLDDRMMAVPFTPDGNTPRFGQPTELFPGNYMMALPTAPRMYDVAPDGRILMLKDFTPLGQGDDLGPRVVLVQNWLDELERLVPN